MNGARCVRLILLLAIAASDRKVTALTIQQRAKQMNPAVPRGTVHRYVYTTSIARNLPADREEFYVYTPPGYDLGSSTRYPVLYLLHGYLEHASSWLRNGRVNLLLDTLISQGTVRPMIVVMPHCYGDYKFLLGSYPMWTLPAKINANVSLFSQMLLMEIAPRVESAYRVSSRREDHAIAGLSMGGLEAITIGVEHPDKFDWVGGFSSAVQKLSSESPAIVEAKGARLRLLWVSYGVSDMRLIVDANRRLVAELRERGVQVTSVETPGRHEWPVWQYNFKQFAPLLFRSR